MSGPGMDGDALCSILCIFIVGDVRNRCVIIVQVVRIWVGMGCRIMVVVVGWVARVGWVV